MYGRLYEEECNYSKALELYHRIKDFDDNNPIECFIANIYLKLLNYDKGIEILNKALEKNSNNTIILFRLFNFYQQKGDIAKSEEILKEILSYSPYNLKYILYTSNLKNSKSLTLYNKIRKVLEKGFDYSPVNRFIGDYYVNKDEHENALDYYQKQLESNPLYPPAYSNGYVVLMELTKYLNNNQETNKFEIIRQKFISEMKINIENETVLCNECEYADKFLCDKIKKFEQLKTQNTTNISYYLSLCDFYKQNQDDEKLKKHIDEMISVFPEALSPYFKLLEYNYMHHKYVDFGNCLRQIIKNMNLGLDSGYFCNKEISNLLLTNSFYVNPDKFDEFFDEAGLNESICRKLVYFYYNLLYKNSKYIDYVYKCIEKLELKMPDDRDLLFIKALVSYIKGKKKEAQKTFDLLLTHKNIFPLIEMIQICGDVLNISYLHDLFINSNYKDNIITKNISKGLKELFFYQNVLLYLLHINYVKSNRSNKKISHYTNLSVVKALLDDPIPGIMRLSSLNSANDPKEGKILFDYLSTGIKDIDTLNLIKHSNQNNVCALQTSFTLLQDALTMFRLYGKTDNLEGTGVNLVFNKFFFSDGIRLPTENIIHAVSTDEEYNNPEETPIPRWQKENIPEKELSLYFVLYYNKQEDILVFNPFSIYNSSIIDLKKNSEWKVINQEEKKLSLDSQDYFDNIGYVFRKLKNIWENLDKTEYSAAKDILLNINYLIKDISFFDEKELRMISIDNLNSKEIKHDSEKYTLYKEYMSLLGYRRYEKREYLDKIFLGPKVKQKESVKEYFLNHLASLGLTDVIVSYSKAPLA